MNKETENNELTKKINCPKELLAGDKLI